MKQKLNKNFTKSELVVHKFFEVNQNILNHSWSITKVAQTIGVSPALINKYCQKMGFEGFKHFKSVNATDRSNQLNLHIEIGALLDNANKLIYQAQRLLTNNKVLKLKSKLEEGEK